MAYITAALVGRRRRARRDRHGVHGQRERAAGGAEHERVGQRRRQEGAPVRPLVRPLRRLPHLHHHLEPGQHPVQGGRRRDPVLQALRRPAVPEREAHGAARHAVGRQLLGHREGQGAGGLVRRALRRLLPGLLRQRLRQRRGLRRRRRRRVDEQAARRRRVGHHPVGREQLHALQLLRRRLAVPPGPPARVQPQLS
ncbi:xyloglucan endo-transglycosylase/hydrolase1 [Zea mays]|uniref:Xyloglucan endo-transglycosylase/hydrolase1 n=1 Tax=Zea mays TaxID=4577 RepID=A0A1D6IZ03_MAIZE|nr:xyloglucan endo-transglycosylase/hydrolase1 [Zea mays]